nr:MAG: hypothetical protein E4H34_06230 [Hyphomicrobiales bacterium]
MSMRTVYALIALGVSLLITALMARAQEADNGLRSASLAVLGAESALSATKFFQGGEFIGCLGRDFPGASIRNTSPTRVNADHSNLAGTGLASARGLTQDQMGTARADGETKFPARINLKFRI